MARKAIEYKTVTLKDIAKKVNITPDSVSMIMCGRGPSLGFARATIDLVLETAEELGYGGYKVIHVTKRIEELFRWLWLNGYSSKNPEELTKLWETYQSNKFPKGT